MRSPWSAAGRRGHHDYRLALVGRCRADWIAQLDAFLRDEPHPGLFTGRASGGRNPELAAALEACAFSRDRDGAVIPALPAEDEKRADGLALLATLYIQGRVDRLGSARPDGPLRPAPFLSLAARAVLVGALRCVARHRHGRSSRREPRNPRPGVDSVRCAPRRRPNDAPAWCLTCKNDSGRSCRSSPARSIPSGRSTPAGSTR